MKLESSVTLFDDNKVEDRFAELQVTADGITAEVGRKVGNDEVISRINQSAESVQIQANKIKIDGVITAINNDTTTTINGGKITTNTVHGDRIIANTVNGDRLIADTVSAGAIKADSGTFNTANIPNLSATKITSDTLDGARINAMGASNGARAALTSTGLDIYNSSNQKKASYGATQYIYGGNGTYPYLQADGSNVGIYQSNTQKAIMSSNGLLVYSGDASNSVALFGSSVRVGKLGQKNIQITDTDFSVCDDDGSRPFQVSTYASTQTDPVERWYFINANSSVTSQMYYRGTLVNNVISVGVATSGRPSASNSVTLTSAGTEYTITVSGVKYTFSRSAGLISFKIENTNSAKRSCLIQFTQTYKETYIRENNHTLDTRYQQTSIEDVTGTCNQIMLYTYGGIAQMYISVYRGSSVSNGGLIYSGRLGSFAPINRCYMAGFVSGVKNVVGYVDGDGYVLVYNVSGGSLNTTSSLPALLSATYILAQ